MIPGRDGFLFGKVTDSGSGVEESFVSQLFEPFSRADSGRNAEGLGLGLASVKAVAEAHGGTVRTKSHSQPDGAEFIIKLPL